LRTKSSPEAAALLERFRSIVSGALEPVIEGAEAYWLEDDHGHLIPPESKRSLAPLFLALGLIRQGHDPDTLTLYARLKDGERFRITSGILLIGIAEHAAGIPRRPGNDRRDQPNSDTPMRRVAVDPIAWREDPESREIQVIDAVSILLGPTLITRDSEPRTSADPASDTKVDQLRRALAEPKELVLDGAEAYWLQDPDGERVGPKSERSLAPMFLALGLVREGCDPDSLILWARLHGGELFEIGGGPSLVAIAAHTAGIPVDPGAAPVAQGLH
jgi:hypothetical protein